MRYKTNNKSEKNGGTFYQKRRYVFIKTEVRFYENGGTILEKI